MTSSPWHNETMSAPVLDVMSTFEGFLNLQWVELNDDSAQVRFQARDDLKQPLGLVHGGIYSAVAETVASFATIRAVWPQKMACSGMSSSANFLRPITAGTVHGAARLYHHDDSEWVGDTSYTTTRPACAS